MSLCLVYKVVEDVVDLFPDVGSQAQELAIYSVKGGLQEISLSWILRVEQSQKLNKQQQLSQQLFLGENSHQGQNADQ